jgi:integrase
VDAVGAPARLVGGLLERRRRVGLYEGTKHSFATGAALRGVPERALQAYLGHADARSTRRYAQLADEALLAVLPPRRGRGVGASDEGA